MPRSMKMDELPPCWTIKLKMFMETKEYPVTRGAVSAVIGAAERHS